MIPLSSPEWTSLMDHRASGGFLLIFWTRGLETREKIVEANDSTSAHKPFAMSSDLIGYIEFFKEFYHFNT